MRTTTTRTRRSFLLASAILFGAVVLTLAMLRGPESETEASPSSASAPATPQPGPDEEPSVTQTLQPVTEARAADPVGIRIPMIDVAAETVPLGLRPDGSIEVPEDFDQTGWWVDGPEPGEPGPAVVLGHVDSVAGPAVFSRLADLSVGDAIHVDREDGTTVSYRVDRIEQHPKHDFPTDAVYGRGSDDSVLRLVTCGGQFDRDVRSYVDNIIVFASMT